eukprot:Gb_14364 [translate_table: standard]
MYANSPALGIFNLCLWLYGFIFICNLLCSLVTQLYDTVASYYDWLTLCMCILLLVCFSPANKAPSSANLQSHIKQGSCYTWDLTYPIYLGNHACPFTLGHFNCPILEISMAQLTLVGFSPPSNVFVRRLLLLFLTACVALVRHGFIVSHRSNITYLSAFTMVCTSSSLSFGGVSSPSFYNVAMTSPLLQCLLLATVGLSSTDERFCSLFSLDVILHNLRVSCSSWLCDYNARVSYSKNVALILLYSTYLAFAYPLDALPSH